MTESEVMNNRLNIRGNCIAITSHHCNEVGDYDTPPVNEKGIRRLKKRGTYSPRYKGILYCVIASVLWSAGGILLKIIDWNPVAIAGSRSIISALILLAYIRKPKFSKSKPQMLGAVAYAATVISFVIANKMTTSANAILLQYTAPIFVAILSFFILKEKIFKQDVATIVVVFLGMILFFVQDVNIGNMIGNLVAILSGFFLASVTVSLRTQKDGSAMETTLLGNLFTFIVAIPFILQVVPDVKSILVIVVLGVFQLGISYIFYVNGLKYITAIEAILVTVLEPLLNPLWVFIFTGESPGLFSIVGGAVVISAVVLRSVYISKITKGGELS